MIAPSCVLNADWHRRISDFAKEQGLHGIDFANAQPSVQTFELPVCFVCHISNGKIDRAREYWDAASMARQLGVTDGPADEEVPTQADRLTPALIIEEWLLDNISRNPASAAKLNGVCQFRITGPRGGDWYLDLTNSDARIGRGTTPSATCSITMSDADFVAFYTGKLSPQRAFITGRLKMQGDLGLASALRGLLKQ